MLDLKILAFSVATTLTAILVILALVEERRGDYLEDVGGRCEHMRR